MAMPRSPAPIGADRRPATPMAGGDGQKNSVPSRSGGGAVGVGKAASQGKQG